MSNTEYDDDRYCHCCRSKQRVHIKILSRRLVELTCLACKAAYELKRFPCGSNRD